jgi:hypothetical protein
MLMFDNGLLATFIPEICMVIAFILCLFTPGFKPDSAETRQAPLVAQVSSYEHQQTSTYQASAYDFHTASAEAPDTKSSLSRYIEKVVPVIFEFRFFTSDGLSFVDFSRPPPVFLS